MGPLCVTAAPAIANCRVIHLLDQIQTHQMRLITNPDTPSFQSDIRLVRRYAGMLDDDMILNAIDAFGFSRQGLNTMRYSAYVKDLLNQTSIDDMETARRHYRKPQVLRTIQNMDKYLNDLRCTAAQVAAAPTPETGVEDFGQGLRDSIREKLDWWVALVGVALIGSAVLFGKIRLMMQSRKETR
jgi:hypothetical protein